MCFLDTKDLSCYTQGCPNIVANQGYSAQAKCQFVKDNKLEFGGCGKWQQRKLPGSVKSDDKHHLCDDCRREASERRNDYYNNVGKHLTESLESQRTRDAQRHREREQLNDTLFSHAGEGWYADQAGQDLGGSGVHLDPGMGVSAMPQELDLDELDLDAGEGSSQGHDQGYRQGGSGGYDQRGGQGSGGWYYQ